MKNKKKITLHATSHDDIHHISHHLQDSIVTTGMILHDKERKIFQMLAHRFCWENFISTDKKEKLRVHAGLHFEGVESIHKRNLCLNHPQRFLNLLSIKAKGKEILLNFSEHAQIKITVNQISCKFQDLDEPHHTDFLPSHTY
jgi:hypothetical protein